MSRSCLTIILAAGEGTRMRSRQTKVLHHVAGLPLINHVVRTAAAAQTSEIALVTGRDANAVSASAAEEGVQLTTFEQHERLGTAHATLAAEAALKRSFDDVLILFGDTPLISAATLAAAREQVAAGSAVSVVGFRAVDPTGYGRLITDGGELFAIREEKDATPTERQIDLCNGGVMALDGRYALTLLQRIGNDNAKGEFYLTDIVELARRDGLAVQVVEASEDELLGINTRAELAKAESIWQQNRRAEAMLNGVTLIAPETVFFAFDTVIEPDVLIEPNVVFGPGVHISEGAVIHAFCHIEGAHIGTGASIGPFARLRPGTDLGPKTKVGNFCETKNARVETGAKINHLTYIGDAHIGAGTNIGAGTITCNYDGYNKFHTEIGANVFVGSNSSLVAPVAIGDGAYVGSGSVITDDVPADALAIGRGRQVVKLDRAKEINARNASLKASRAKRSE